MSRDVLLILVSYSLKPHAGYIPGSIFWKRTGWTLTTHMSRRYLTHAYTGVSGATCLDIVLVSKVLRYLIQCIFKFSHKLRKLVRNLGSKLFAPLSILNHYSVNDSSSLDGYSESFLKVCTCELVCALPCQLLGMETRARC
jgi:hypothetical protein